MMLGYAIEVSPDDNDTLLVTCVALPELTTFGTDLPDASRRAGDAVEEALSARMSEGRDLPALQHGEAGRDFAALPIVTALKIALYRALREDGLTRAELQRRLQWPHREQVDRLFRLDHASRVSQLEAAFHALGRELEINVSRNLAA